MSLINEDGVVVDLSRAVRLGPGSAAKALHIAGLMRHANGSSNHGFTMVELLITITILGILSGIATLMYREQVKKAHATEVKTQLGTASKKLSIAAKFDPANITQATCLNHAELNDSQNFIYSCEKRTNINVFDIAVKPSREIGVGGLLSFEPGNDKVCWDVCDATGSGSSAQLSKKHLDLSGNCSALTRKVIQQPCNCTSSVTRQCLYYPGGHKRKPSSPPLCGLWICKGWDKPRCKDVTTQTCQTCTVVVYQ